MLIDVPVELRAVIGDVYFYIELFVDLGQA
jgi:hypothetical protein